MLAYLIVLKEKTMKTKMLILLMAVMFVTSVGWTQSAVSAQRRAQRKLLAQRAARADAMRRLAERIKGLQITSETTVNDFVAENDQIQTSMQTFLMGAKDEGSYKHMDDGTCEITMSVTLKSIIRELNAMHKAYYKGSKVKMIDIQKMKETVKLTKIEETGMGAMPEELEDTLPDPPATRSTGSIPAYWKKHCTGRGRLMAKRAAQVDAMRRLAERIKGLKISSDTTVNDFVAESDVIQTELRASLRGAKEVRVKYLRNELICEVTMQVHLKTIVGKLYTSVKANYKGSKVKMKSLQTYVENVRIDKFDETGTGCPPEKYLKDYTAAQAAAVKQISGPNVPGWASTSLTVKGQSAIDSDNTNAAQAKLMAARGAELDARRKLAERVNGLRINSSSSVKDFVTQHDSIRTRMVSYQLGAHVVDGSKKTADGIVEVEVTMPLQPVWKTISYTITKTSR